MKVTFKNMIGGYTGMSDEVIFYWDPRLQRILARRKPRVKISKRHLDFGAATKNLMLLNPSQDYRNDLRSYAERTYSLPEFKGVRPLWNNIYLKLMHAMKRLYPAIDLKTLTREDILTLDLPCVSVKRAVEAGLLPPVGRYEQLTALL